MKLTLIIDTDEIQEMIEDSCDYGESSPMPFEQAIIEIAKANINEIIQKQIYEAMETTKAQHALLINEQVEEVLATNSSDYLQKVINERIDVMVNKEIVLTDRWGEKKFVGTVEDYIQKEIDSKLVHRVDSNGQALKGACSTSSGETYVEYAVNRKIDAYKDLLNKSIEKDIQKKWENLKSEIVETVDQLFKNAQSEAFKDTVEKRLKEAGIL